MVSRIASSLFLGDRTPGWLGELVRAGRGDLSEAEEAKFVHVLELYCSDFKDAFSLFCVAVFLPIADLVYCDLF